MNLNDIASKKVAILGVGIEGLALADFLCGKCQSVTLLDQKDEVALLEESPELKEVLCFPNYRGIFGENYLSDLKQYDIVFRSPGFRLMNKELQEAKAAGVEISSQIKLFFDLCPARIIGVTGTKGKGTTSSLIYEIMRKSLLSGSEKSPQVYLAGNIGKPAITLIPNLRDDDIVILELSSFQLQDLHKSPHIAVVLNISSDHLDYHLDNSEYVQAKLPIVKYQERRDVAIINMDYLASFEFSAQTNAKTYFFSGRKSVDEGAFVRQAIDGDDCFEVILRVGDIDKVICSSREIKLVGRHNLENIAAASLAAYLAGAEIGTIAITVKEFAGLPHRLEPVSEINGIKIFNDSFSTNPEPAIAALHSFAEPKLLILGGSSKGADFDALAREISDADIRGVALIGDESLRLKSALFNAGYAGHIFESGYVLKAAVDVLLGLGEPGDVMIFSPACASFDMFKNYKERGEAFKDIIHRFESS